MEFIRQRLGLILRIIICVSILGYLSTKINWTELWTAIIDTSPTWLLAATLIWGLSLFWMAWRWYLLLHVQGIRVSLGMVFQLTMVGQFFNSFLLGTTGGDVIKIYYATRAAPTKRSAAGLSVVVDRVMGLSVLILIAVIFVAVHYQFLVGNAETRAMVWTVLAVASGLAMVFIAVIFLPTLKKWAKNLPYIHHLPMQDRFARVYDAFARYRTEYAVMSAITVMSFINHFTIFVAAYVQTMAMGFEVPFWLFISFLPIIFLLIAIPISFSGLGVREVLFVWFFGLLGVGETDAVAFSLLFFGMTLAWSLVGGLFYLRYETPEDIKIDELT